MQTNNLGILFTSLLISNYEVTNSDQFYVRERHLESRICVKNYFGYCTQDIQNVQRCTQNVHRRTQNVHRRTQQVQGTNSVMWSSSFYNDFFEYETFLRHVQKWKKISIKKPT